jgi:hypothetical protein
MLVGIFLGVAVSTQAFAGKKDFGIQVSGLIGYMSSSSSGTSNTGLTYGGRLGYQLNSKWEGGINFTSFTATTTINVSPPFTPFTISNSLTLMAVDLNYHLSGNLHPLYTGILMGLGLSPTSGSSLMFGLRGGYDFVLGRGFSVGPLAQLMVVMAANNILIFQGLATISYSF